jgi:quinol monooxygenase YgiN
VPLFLRRCAARDGQEGLLRRELIRVHEERTPRLTGLLEAAVYREHLQGREFLSLELYEDEAAAGGPARAAMLEALDETEGRHAEVAGVSIRLEVIYEYASIPQRALHSAAALLVARPEGVPRLRERLGPGVAVLAERLKPRRVIAAQGHERPELFVVVGDSEWAFDVDRYLTSGFGRRITAPLEPFLARPPRYFVLDPVWRYFRRLGGTARE